MFRLAFRFISAMDTLGIVLFYNVPLLMKLPRPRFTIPGYILLMGALEVYLVVTLRRGVLPLKTLLAYFGAALLFDLPYAPFAHVSLGLTLFVIPWYLAALAGFGLALSTARSSSGA